MNIQKQLEVQGATQQWVASFMNTHNIDAATMLNTLNGICLQLKDQVMTDLLYYIQEEKLKNSTPTMASEQPQEQEIEDGSSSQ